MVKQVIVGAHYGLRGWLTQRVTGLVMAIFTVAFIVVLIAAEPTSHFKWRELFSGHAMKLATFLFVVALLLHSWVGMRDILMDYARPMGVRLALEILVVVLLVAWGGWALLILWSVR